MNHPAADVIATEIKYADTRYGPFKSTHEALGVLVEEMSELVDAIRSNKLESVFIEACQVSAVAARLAHGLREHGPMRQRSTP